MSNTAVADVVELLGQQRILEPGPLSEVKSAQGRFSDPRALFRELIQRGWLTSYQASMILQGRGASLTLGSYLILDLLGEGGAGQVFKAKHVSMHRIVALKVVRPELARDPEVVARFYREIEVASHIAHPNIVHAFDAGPIGSALVLAMEFVDGTDLDKMVKEHGILSLGQSCDYIKQAASGLAHAHEKGLVHRDIKPSNLLVATKLSAPGAGNYGVVKILDLGLARLQHPSAGSATKNLTVLAGNSVMQGTPDYMAPEQAIDFHTADARADIYSLGCTFFFLLTGQPPFTGSLPEKMMKHQAAPPPPVEDFRKDVPPAVSEIIKKMLAKRPGDRFATAGEVAQALTPFIPTRRKSAVKMPEQPARPPSGPIPKPTGARRSKLDLVNKPASQIGKARRSKGRLLLLTMIGTVVFVGGIAGLFYLLSLHHGGDSTETTRLVASRRTARDFDTTLVTLLAIDTRPQPKSGQGKAFNGKTDRIDEPNNPDLEPPQISIEAWVNPAEIPGGDDKRRWLVNKNVHEDTNGHYALMLNGPKVGAYLNIDGKFEVWSAGDVLKPNVWQHLAMTYDGVGLRIYRDGSEVGLTVVERPARKPGDKPLTIGCRQDGYDKSFFNGKLDDIRIYNRPLTADEIKTHWMRPQAPVPETEKGLAYQKKF